jgi:nucleotide-binding universal stress UspA family protein
MAAEPAAAAIVADALAPKTVLACVDGSAMSMDAVRFAISHLRPEDKLVLLNAFVDDPNEHDSFALYQFDHTTKARERSESLLRKTVELCKPPAKTKIISSYCQDVPAEIVKIARLEDAFVIVMGSRGISGVSKVLIGSVSLQVLKTAGIPVTIVRKPAPASVDAHVTLVAVDGSEQAIEALRTAVRLGGLDHKLLLLSVYETNISNPEPKRTDAEKAIEFAEAALKGKGPLPAFESVVQPATKTVGETIVRYAAEHRITSIVMGSRGLSGLKKMWLGSVSEYVLDYAPCPVTVVRLKPYAAPGPA